MIASVQVAPGGSVPVQVPELRAKAVAPVPVRATPLTVSGVVPVLVSVTVCGAELECATVCGKLKAAAESATLGPMNGVPRPVSGIACCTVAPLLPLLSVSVRFAT